MRDEPAPIPDPDITRALAASRQESLARLARDRDIDLIYVFGSRALEVYRWFMGQQDSLAYDGSDVDIGVKAGGDETDTDLRLDEKVDLETAIEELLAVARVDLVTFVEANAFLAANVIRGERLYVRDGHQADEFELYILRRAGDLAPFERQRQAMILGRDR